MTGTEFDLEQALAVLSRTPSTLDTLLRDLPDAWTTCNEGPQTFSAFDVVGHLIHGEHTDWMVRLEFILKEGERRTFEPFDRFGASEGSEKKTLEQLLDEFASLRRSNLTRLRALELDAEKLELRGRHPEFGPVTARQLLSTWVVHDLGHLAQIARVMSKRYTTEVGPWIAYLPILTRPYGAWHRTGGTA